MTIDEQHEAETRDRRVTCPLLVCGAIAALSYSYDLLRLWREVATDVTGRSLPGGQKPPEELPERNAMGRPEFIVA